jgi:hypothetical protein
MTLGWQFLDETYRRLWGSQMVFVNDLPKVGTVLPEMVDA